MLILYNLTFGIVINLLLIFNCLLDKNIYWIYFLGFSIFYYILDTCIEAFYFKRFMYIPHHIISCFICFFLFSIGNINNASLILLLIESTTLLVNVREVLKQKKKLSLTTDFIFLLYYALIRCFITPYLTCSFRNNKIIYFAANLIFLMSTIWSFIWAKNLYRRYNKIKNINNSKIINISKFIS